MASVLIVFASEHHSTQQIAARIGTSLTERGRDEVHKWPLSEPTEHAERLRSRAVMFSVGITTALPRPLRMPASRTEQPRITRLVDLLLPREHRRFSGVVQRGHLGRKGSVLFRLLGCRYGDYRDWADIDAWTAGISRDWQVGPTGRSSPAWHGPPTTCSVEE
ncbi:flavodoxin [Streptomyces sp. NPDC006627]|uniref:flavodoxin n=1 Tax=Streptomyces sp. NPDC006627 TaxID=3154679 RepID=UPI0033A28D8F